MTNEQIKQAVERDTRRRAYNAEWQREYRRKHPERVLQTYIRHAIKLLTANGYEILKDGERI